MNISDLVNYLSFYHPELYLNQPQKCEFNDVSIFDPTQSLNYTHQNLLILKTSELTKIQTKSNLNIICINDSKLSTDQLSLVHSNLLVVQTKIEVTALFTEIDHLLSEYNTFTSYASQLYELYYSAKGLHELLCAGSRFLKNPMLLDNADSRLIESTEYPNIDDILAEFYIADSSSHLIRKNSDLIELPSDIHSFIRKYQYEKYYFYHCPIMVNHKKVASLSIFETEKPLSIIDLDLIALLCHVIAMELQKDQFNRNVSGLMVDYLILDLIEGKLKDPLQIHERMDASSWKLKNNQYLLTINSGYYDISIATIKAVREELIRLFSFERSIIYNHNLIIILSTDEPEPLDVQMMSQLSSYLDRNHLLGGFSRSFHDLSDLNQVYQQSLKALEFGILYNNRQALKFYEDYAIFDLMENCGDKNNLRKICNPAIFQLINYDQQYKTSYTQTIYHYLMCRGNHKQTSNYLNISSSALIYRINKIKEMINCNITNTDFQFELILSFKILEYLKEIPVFSDLKL